MGERGRIALGVRRHGAGGQDHHQQPQPSTHAVIMLDSRTEAHLERVTTANAKPAELAKKSFRPAGNDSEPSSRHRDRGRRAGEPGLLSWRSGSPARKKTVNFDNHHVYHYVNTLPEVVEKRDCMRLNNT